MRTSRSLDSVEDGSGAEMGVKDEYPWLRVGSPDPYASGDSISLVAPGLSSSRGCGRVRLLFPDDDSGPCSGPICCCGVIVGPTCIGIGRGGVRSCACVSGPGGDASDGVVIDALALLTGG